MLLKYRSDYEKVAMGLLSLIPDFKDIHQVTAELEWYKQADSRELFLYKDEDNDIIGIAGVEQKTNFLILRLIALAPQARQQANSLKMLDELNRAFPENRIMGTLETTAIVEKWEKQYGR
ncbi:riboflavin biosynthesis acetyltransferase RibT [Secundilactobacillus oryzae JCM 18671]|uniref:Riboflavin biosynthesis acetyltransferase RibT n=1 Tax=Secundilactobacillus oryzae JCM 18671 TaxID=1291743 RepID=A0A081BHA7_9LACO|nr:hypothetical protein [Secundilactobacillus oryzae]GAK47425.1 riboflavin biosynthesis acetyltransferase RibT [Secundilactobacillus oryzae JCM 18671]